MKEDRDASDFFVEIVNADPYNFYNAAVDGFLQNFGQNIQVMKQGAYTLEYLLSSGVG